MDLRRVFFRMAPTEYTIGNPSDEPPPAAAQKRAPRKTRCFSAHLLACIEADALWPGGKTETQVGRPVAAWFGGSEDALRPFVANLREGRRAMPPGNGRRSGKGLEFLKTSGVQVAWQRYPEGAVVRLWLPDLFALDPAAPDEGAPVAFVTAPSAAWVARLGLTSDQQQAVWTHLTRINFKLDQELPEHLPQLALAWAAQLDRRVRWPLVSDPRFAAQLLVAFLSEKLCFTSAGQSAYHESDVREVGLLSGVATLAAPEQAGEVVARETALFFALTDPSTRPRSAVDADELRVLRELAEPRDVRLARAKMKLARVADFDEAQDFLGALDRLKKRKLVSGDMTYGHELTTQGHLILRAQGL